MRIPRHWQRAKETARIHGKPWDVCAWGYSDESPEDARRMAVEKLPRIREAIEARSLRRSYDYLADPIREHRVETWGPEGEEHTVITRNGYGALVLNVAGVMFIDVDVAPGWKFLFWGKSTAQRKREAADRVESHVRSGPLKAVRIYETAGGLRVVALDRLYEPGGAEAMQIMKEMGADPLYLRLCRAQKCFRARLTPKPWRIGIDRPPFRFPENPDDRHYREWVDRYGRFCRKYQTCRLVGTVGTDPRDGLIQETLRVHDEHCRVEGSERLA